MSDTVTLELQRHEAHLLCALCLRVLTDLLREVTEYEERLNVFPMDVQCAMRDDAVVLAKQYADLLTRLRFAGGEHD